MNKYISLYLFVMIAIVVTMVKIDQSEAVDEVIRQVRVEGLYGMDEEEFKELIGLHVNEKLDPMSVRLGIKRIYLTDRFESIVVFQDDHDPSNIVIQVREKYVIDKIVLEGLENIKKKNIFNKFLIKEKEFYDDIRLETAVRELKIKVADMGYPDITISSSVKFYEKKHAVRIRLVIKEGAPLIIEKINIIGLEDRDEVDRALIILKVFTGDIFNKSYLIERLTELEKRYKKEGYYNPSIGLFDYSNGIMTLFIELGDMLDIEFKGNEYYSNSRLREEMHFKDVESIDSEIIEEASIKIIDLYHKAGFPFAQVAPVIKENKGSVKIVFFVYEGTQVQIGNVDISGNSIDQELLKNIMSLKEGKQFNPDSINNDRKVLQEFYYALGFRDISIAEFEYDYNDSKTEADLLINISEGSQTLIGGIFLEGNHAVLGQEIIEAISIKPLSPYNEISISDARYAIINLYKQKGLLDVTVDIKRKFSTNRVYPRFSINEGTRYYFGHTIVRGNRDIKQKVITRELINEKGEPFNMMLLRRNTRKLYKLGLFSSVDYRIVDDEENQKSVVLDVEESNAGAVEFGIGYGDYEKGRGFIDVSYKNFFGMNRHGQVRLELTSLSEKLIISAYEPWLHYFPGSYGPLSLRLGILYENRTEKSIDSGDTLYELERYGVGVNFEMNFAERVKGEVLYSLSENDTSNVAPGTVLSREDIGTLIISAITPRLIYDSRDHPYSPRKGNLTGISMELAANYIGSETDYIKYEVKTNHYFGLLKRLVLAVSLRGGLADGFHDTEELPIIKRYFLGGRTTVRGYAQDKLGPKTVNDDPIGGNVFLMHNLETRVDVWKSFGVVIFLDGGNVWLDKNDVDLNEYKFTVGAGVRYMTPVGPFRLDYGHKLDREEGEDAGEIHFSIGHAF